MTEQLALFGGGIGMARQPGEDEACIYRLLDRDGLCRYIGITTWTLTARLVRHWAQPSGQLKRWMATLASPPTIEAICYVPLAMRLHLEREAIAAALEDGQPILNTMKRGGYRRWKS